MTTATWTLGDTPVNRIGYGTMKLPAWPVGEQPGRETALGILRKAVELGVNHFDTSGFYGRDGVTANELLRAALHPYDGLVLATKIGPRFDETTPLGYAEPGELRRDLEDNLSELGVDSIDVVNLRLEGMEGPSDGPVGPHFEALASLREEGLVRHLGLSNATPRVLREARRIAPVACVQNHYNLVHRDDDAMVEACAADGTAYVPFFPLGGHVDPRFLQSPLMRSVAARHDGTPSQVALAWLLRRSPNILLIPGTANPRHLADNTAAADITLTDEDLAELERATSNGETAVE